MVAVKIVAPSSKRACQRLESELRREPPRMPDMNDPAYMEIVRTRVKLLFEHPFYGQLATRLIAVPRPGAGWTSDGRHLFYDPTAVLAATKAEKLFQMKRLVSRVVFAAFGHRQQMDPKVRNEIIAATIQTCAIVGGKTPPYARRLIGSVAPSHRPIHQAFRRIAARRSV